MSLFDSVYDAADEPEESADVLAPTTGEELAPIDVPEAAPASPFALGGGEQLESSPLLVESQGAGPSMSLQDFAVEVFGNHAESEPPAEEPSPFAAAPDMASDVSDEPAPPEPEPAGLEALETAVSTMVPPPVEPVAAFHSEEPFLEEPPSPSDPALGDSPTLQPLVLVDDDLLPGRRAGRGLSISLPSLPGGGLGGRMTAVLVIVVGLVTGFLGYRAVSGGGNGSSGSVGAGPGTDQAGAVNGSVAPSRLPGGPVGALDAAQLAAAEVDLRSATVQAQAHFAENQSFAADWGQILGRTVMEAGAPVSTEVLQAVGDQDAACFQIGLMNGATVAAGVTAGGITFSSDAAGASICTADAAVLAGWPSSLNLAGA